MLKSEPFRWTFSLTFCFVLFWMAIMIHPFLQSFFPLATPGQAIIFLELLSSCLHEYKAVWKCGQFNLLILFLHFLFAFGFFFCLGFLHHLIIEASKFISIGAKFRVLLIFTLYIVMQRPLSHGLLYVSIPVHLFPTYILSESAHHAI